MSYIETGHFEASGADVALPVNHNSLPNVAIFWNEVKFGTDGSNILMFWHKDYSAGDGSIILNEDSSANASREQTNAVTQNDSVAFSETSNNVSSTHTLNLSLGSAFRGADSDEIFYLLIWSDHDEDKGDINA